MSESHNRRSDHPSEASRMGRIIYETRINGETLAKEIPFVVGVLADLSGAPSVPLPPFGDREFVEVCENNLDQILAAAEPRLAFRLENTLTGDGAKLAVELRFRRLEDFEPEFVARSVEPLRRLLDTRDQLVSLVRKVEGNRRLEEMLQYIIENVQEKESSDADVALNAAERRRFQQEEESSDADEWEEMEVEWDKVGVSPDLFDEMIEESRLAGDKERRREAFNKIISKAMKPKSFGQGERLMPKMRFWIAETDHRVSRQIEPILHDISFQKLHATWLGLRDLVRRAGSTQGIAVKVLNVTKRELFSDRESASDRRASVFYRKVYCENYDTIGASPSRS